MEYLFIPFFVTDWTRSQRRFHQFPTLGPSKCSRQTRSKSHLTARPQVVRGLHMRILKYIALFCSDLINTYCNVHEMVCVGVTLLVVSDPRQPSSGCEQLLRRIHELYVDYALKNPFHPLDMPVRWAIRFIILLIIFYWRCRSFILYRILDFRGELFDVNVRHVMDATERTGNPL